jgi:ligand-binding SRPBCC domain-containing protein
MPRYLVVRKFEVDGDEMPQVGRRSRVAIEGSFPEIVWEHSHVTVDDDGLVRTFCVYDTPDMETVMKHSSVLGQHQIDSIHEIAGDVTPADFPG